MDVKLSLEWLDQHSARHHRSRHSKVRVQKWRQRTFVCCYPWIWTYADEDSCGNEHGQPNRTWACWILSAFCRNQEGSRGIELETCILLITFLSNLVCRPMLYMAWHVLDPNDFGSSINYFHLFWSNFGSQFCPYIVRTRIFPEYFKIKNYSNKTFFGLRFLL